MATIIVQSDWPDSLSDTTSLVERVVPRASRDEAYIRQLVERVMWALEDAERSEGLADLRRTGVGVRPAGEPAGADLRPAGSDLRPAGSDLRPAGADLRPAGAEVRSAGADLAARLVAVAQ